MTTKKSHVRFRWHQNHRQMLLSCCKFEFCRNFGANSHIWEATTANCRKVVHIVSDGVVAQWKYFLTMYRWLWYSWAFIKFRAYYNCDWTSIRPRFDCDEVKPPSHGNGMSRNQPESAGMKHFQNSSHIRAGSSFFVRMPFEYSELASNPHRMILAHSECINLECNSNVVGTQ